MAGAAIVLPLVGGLSNEYLRSLEDHVALQCRRRNNKQLTPDDHCSLEKMLI